MIAQLGAITVRHGATVALDAVDLEVESGTLTAVVGGDGAGKTTLLRVLVGAVAPSSGQVSAPPRERLGNVAAGSGTHPDLTVEENLRFCGAAYHVRRGTLEDRIHALLAATELTEARHRLAAHLSGGMRQKLAFACATLHEPELLVMDEPTTGVDPVSRAELWRLVSASLSRGTAAVFSTTYVDEAARADRVVVLDRGRAIARGTPTQIRDRVPGVVVRSDADLSPLPSWRRGRARHSWSADGGVPDDATRIDPDLEDAVVVAALAAGREDRA